MQLDFNPRTHGECDTIEEAEAARKAAISIHALTGSATKYRKRLKSIDKISIHALTGSATSLLWGKYFWGLYFNPRTHGECDDRIQTYKTVATLISIHALTGSATTSAMITALTQAQFQSTHSRGVRLLHHLLIDFRRFISIHALTGSATIVILSGNICNDWFQSTHSRGVRLLVPVLKQKYGKISIHALTGSATLISLPSLGRGLISIHALTGSATHSRPAFLFHL